MTLTLAPIRIPSSVRTDRELITLCTARRNLLLRYSEVARRVNPYLPNRAKLESARTKERRKLASRLRVVERELMRLLGEITQNPAIYTAPHTKEDPLKLESYALYHRQIRAWYLSHRRASPHFPPEKRNAENAKRTHKRHVLAYDIQQLEWNWLSALTLKLFPNDPLPPRRHVNVRRFKP